MKKIFIVLMVLFWSSPVSALDFMNVINMKSAGSLWNSAEKILYTPATVRGVTGAVAATETVALSIPSVRGAAIMAALAGAGFTFIGGVLWDYFNDLGYENKDGALKYKTYAPSTLLYPEDIVNSSYVSGSWQGYHLGVYPTEQAAYDAVKDAISAKVGSNHYSGTNTNGYYQHGGLQAFNYSYLRGFWATAAVAVGGVYYEYQASYPKAGCESRYTTNYQYVEKTTAQVEAALKTGLDSGNQTAVNALNESLGRVEQSLNNLSDPLNSTSQKTSIQTNLDASIPAGTSTILDEKIAAPDAMQTYLNETMTNSAVQTSSLTKADVQDAVKNAINDDSGVVEPSEPVITPPEKLSLTSVLQSFWDSISNLPIINTIKGITVNCSGTSVICLNLPSNYGGSRCWDAANIQNELNMAGTALLSIVTIFAFIGIFRG
jgi:hypothetical protein